MRMKEKTVRESNSPRPNHTIKAYHGIRQMLFHHELVPGQKIGYRDLSERLKMSITPIIQALKFLEFQGLVRHEPNRGYYIEPIYMKEVEEIYDLRQIVEVSLLSESLKKINENDIMELENTLNAYKKAGEKRLFNQLLVEHKNFHLKLASVSGCRIQVQILKYLFDLLYFKYGGSILFAPFEGSKNTEHHKIFEAVVKRNVKFAQKKLSEHILNTKKRLITDFEKMISERKIANF
jgi:DNA-binding GntR family transcriptional regulator